MSHLLKSVNEQAESIRQYLPQVKLFKGATLQSLLVGLAEELFKVDRDIRLYNDEIIPTNTVKYLGEWEKAVGIPDSCFTGTGSFDERRTHVLAKLGALGVQTSQDFVDVAALFGIAVTVSSGTDSGLPPATFPLTFPFTMFGGTKQDRFTIVVTYTVTAASRFPWTFPYTFGDDTLLFLECLFNKLKPANCSVIFEQV